MTSQREHLAVPFEQWTDEERQSIYAQLSRRVDLPLHSVPVNEWTEEQWAEVISQVRGRSDDLARLAGLKPISEWTPEQIAEIGSQTFSNQH
ncbi:hypothetical protein ACYPKM_05320 [Pseudomonas aeruginosa]